VEISVELYIGRQGALLMSSSSSTRVTKKLEFCWVSSVIYRVKQLLRVKIVKMFIVKLFWSTEGGGRLRRVEEPIKVLDGQTWLMKVGFDRAA